MKNFIEYDEQVVRELIHSATVEIQRRRVNRYVLVAALRWLTMILTLTAIMLVAKFSQ